MRRIKNMLKGYKTYIAAAGLALLGIVEIINGNIEGALARFAEALGFLGIGAKIERKL